MSTPVHTRTVTKAYSSHKVHSQKRSIKQTKVDNMLLAHIIVLNELNVNHSELCDIFMCCCCQVQIIMYFCVFVWATISSYLLTQSRDSLFSFDLFAWLSEMCNTCKERQRTVREVFVVLKERSNMCWVEVVHSYRQTDIREFFLIKCPKS